MHEGLRLRALCGTGRVQWSLQLALWLAKPTEYCDMPLGVAATLAMAGCWQLGGAAAWYSCGASGGVLADVGRRDDARVREVGIPYHLHGSKLQQGLAC